MTLTLDSDTVQKAIQFINSSKLPNDFKSPRDKYLFKKRFENSAWNVMNNKLFFNLKGKNKEVIPKENIETKLAELYDSPLYIGIGINGFYKKIAEIYLGITR